MNRAGDMEFLLEDEVQQLSNKSGGFIAGFKYGLGVVTAYTLWSVIVTTFSIGIVLILLMAV